jgi:hypothetical protein
VKRASGSSRSSASTTASRRSRSAFFTVAIAFAVDLWNGEYNAEVAGIGVGVVIVGACIGAGVVTLGVAGIACAIGAGAAGGAVTSIWNGNDAEQVASDTLEGAAWGFVGAGIGGLIERIIARRAAGSVADDLLPDGSGQGGSTSGSTTSSAGSSAGAALSRASTIKATLKDALRENKLKHILYGSKTSDHMLQGFIARVGGERQAIKRITYALFSGSIRQDSRGQFLERRVINGILIEISGRVVNGVPRIAGAWRPR